MFYLILLFLILSFIMTVLKNRYHDKNQKHYCLLNNLSYIFIGIAIIIVVLF